MIQLKKKRKKRTSLKVDILELHFDQRELLDSCEHLCGLVFRHFPTSEVRLLLEIMGRRR